MRKKLGIEVFKTRAFKRHGNKFSYIDISYTGMAYKIGVICPEHGLSYQRAGRHLEGNGCQACSHKIRVMPFSVFKEKAIAVHRSRYKYIQVSYSSVNCKVGVICPVHGVYYPQAFSHLKGHGCASCKSHKSKTTFKDFVIAATNKHDGLYTYFKEGFEESNTILASCDKHGKFSQLKANHLAGHGCKSCARIGN